MVRSLLAIIFCFSISISLTAQDFTTTDPVDYNNYIVSEQNKLLNKMVEYIVQTIHNDNYREVESKRLEVIGEIERTINRLEKLEPFKGDSQMKNEALAVCRLFHEAHTDDYSKINMLKRNREASFEAMENYFKAQDYAEKKLNKAADRFENAQKSFALQHKIKIVDIETDATILTISRVNQYSRKIFLEFFKISKINASCLDALNKQDIAKLEACRVQMMKESDISQQELSATEGFEGDDEFKSRTLAYIKYHHLFANEDLKELSSILNAEERSPAQIERYNEIIKAYNHDLQTLIKNFNEANIHLFRKYIPNTTFKNANTGKQSKG